MTKSTGKPSKRLDEIPEESNKVKRRQAPGKTIKAREDQLISLAYDLVEKRIRKGTATSQEVTQFIKAGSSQSQLEKVKIEQENILLKAKAEALQSQKRVEELYSEAMKAFRTYSGQEQHDDENQ